MIPAGVIVFVLGCALLDVGTLLYLTFLLRYIRSIFTCIMATFSLRQRSQLRVPGLYGFACFRISYWMLGAGCSSFSHTHLDKAVAFFFIIVGERLFLPCETHL